MFYLLENLLDFSFVEGQSLRRRGSAEQLPEPLEFFLQEEGSKSFVLDAPIDDYKFSDTANSFIGLAIIDGISASAHSFLSSFSKVQTPSFRNVASLGFDISSFSNAIYESIQIPPKNIIKRLDNHLLDGDNPIGLSSCFCPSCSRLNVMAEDSELHTSLAPKEVPFYLELSGNIDLDDTFYLHSNPAANHTIYLDFNGFSIDSTPWENGASMSLSPFYDDLDLPEVREEIQNIWNRVSADFAPFNINVTTEEPDVEDLRNRSGNDLRWGIRVALTLNQNLDNLDFFGNPQQITNAGGGGTAFYKSFNWLNDDVAFVFNRGEYAASETVSHEVGHALNLRHDGTNTRTNNTTYYEGHGVGEISWASIMGAPFIGDQENVTTWSKGEYNDANNIEDDLSIITSENGFGYRIDDHGNNFNSASALSYSGIDPLNLNKLDILTHGLIERNIDFDYFVFETSGGVLNLDISNVTTAYVLGDNNVYEKRYLNPRGPNLDISATLYNSEGKSLANSNPKNFLSASFNNIQLSRGSYFLKIKGEGTGNPLDVNPTGYTSYSSLGEYLVNGSVITDEPFDAIRSFQTYKLKYGEKDLILLGTNSIDGTGNRLNNKITGNNAKNIIDGKKGADEMAGKKGKDIYYVNNKNDTVIELTNQGIDTVRSYINESLSANVENLELLGKKAINATGNKLNNKLKGNNNNNIIKAKAGEDTIIGDLGLDILTGGKDADLFRYLSIDDSGTTKATRDRITDFSAEDTIDLSKIDADQDISGNQKFVFIGSDSFSDAGQVRFKNGFLSVNADDDLGSDLSIKLEGVTELFASSLIL